MNKLENKTLNLFCIEAICGAGKSHAFINHINSLPFDKKYIYCVPTLALAQELSRKIPSALNLTSNNESLESIGAEICEAIKAYSPKLENIIITHKGLKILSDIVMNSEERTRLESALKGWVLVVDEALEPFINGKVIPNGKIAEQLNILSYTEQTFINEKENRKTLVKTNTQAIAELMDETSIFSSKVSELFYCLLNGGCVEGAFEEGTGFTEYDYLCLSPVYSLIPVFKQVYFLGASIRHSPFCVVGNEVFGWSYRNAPEPLQPIPERREHANQHLITVISAVNGKVGLTALGYEECTLFKQAAKAFIEHIGNAGFIFASNHNRPTGNFKKESDRIFCDGDRVPFISSGVNFYAGLLEPKELIHLHISEEKEAVYSEGFRHAVWMGVAYLSNEAKGQIARYIESLGGNPDSVIRSIEDFQTNEAAYQMLMRCRARRFDNDKPVFLYVVSEHIADYICTRYLPKAKRKRLDIKYISESKSKKSIRDKNIVELSNLGLSTRAIADKMDISKNTVTKVLKKIKKAA